jgi:hypothetical protein
MIYFLKIYLVLLSAFLAKDIIWLGLVARPFHQQYLAFLMASSKRSGVRLPVRFARRPSRVDRPGIPGLSFRSTT